MALGSAQRQTAARSRQTPSTNRAAVVDSEQGRAKPRAITTPLWFAREAIVLRRDTLVVARAAARGRSGRGVRGAPLGQEPPPVKRDLSGERTTDTSALGADVQAMQGST